MRFKDLCHVMHQMEAPEAKEQGQSRRRTAIVADSPRGGQAPAIDYDRIARSWRETGGNGGRVLKGCASSSRGFPKRKWTRQSQPLQQKAASQPDVNA
ncbi:MAG: hypothetical protein ACLTNH_15345 [Enterocloster sp.]